MSKSQEAKVGDLRVWWIAQVPGKAFHVDVASVQEGVKMMDTLALYDLHQLEVNVKGDFANAGGLEVFTADGGPDGKPGWEAWFDDETAEDDPRAWLAALEPANA